MVEATLYISIVVLATTGNIYNLEHTSVHMNTLKSFLFLTVKMFSVLYYMYVSITILQLNQFV